MKVLIVYGTTEGQTKKIAHALISYFKDQAVDLSAADANDLFNLDLNAYDVFIVMASVHHGEHQSAALHFVKDNKDLLNQKPSCFLSVSLNAALPDEEHLKETQHYVERFLEKTAWKPVASLCVAGAIRYTEMDYFRRELARSIIQRTLGTTSANLSQDFEFTDFEGLYSFVEAFLQERMKVTKTKR